MAQSISRGLVFAGLTFVAAVGALTFAFTGTSPAQSDEGQKSQRGASENDLQVPSANLVIYSGRAESLVGDLIQRFRDETGINVSVKYAATGPLAALVLEEGKRTPADVFFAQDPGGLGVLGEAGRLAELPGHLQEKVAYEFRDPNGTWVGVTGRLRTIAYSTDRLSEDELPQTTRELVDGKWRGRVGWAPSNASFQAFVTAMRHQHGEEATEQWLRGMIDNGVRVFANNVAILQGIADGEIDLGLVNHYYAHRIKAERNGNFAVANHVPVGEQGEGDIGAAMLISGAAILEDASNRANAERFVEFLLSETAQQYFAEKTYEYPLANGFEASEGVPALKGLTVRSVDLTALADLRETVKVLRKVGALR